MEPNGEYRLSQAERVNNLPGLSLSAVPFVDIIAPNLRSLPEIKGPSGAILIAGKSLSNIVIAEPKDYSSPKFDKYKAWYFRAYSEDGTFNCEARTHKKGFLGKRRRHPDLNAKKLYLQSFNYFDELSRQNGSPLAAIAAQWDQDDDLAEEFNRYLLSGTSREVAARQTWEGRRAAELGFTEVHDVQFKGPAEYQRILVRFERPALQAA